MRGADGWQVEPVLRDLIRQFPLPIALASQSGEAVICNDHFEQSFDRDALDAALRQTVGHPSDSGWQTVRLYDRAHDEVDIEAQVLCVSAGSMLILNDVASSALLRQLDQLRRRLAELERRSTTDSLTGIWNRAHFDRVIPTELDRSLRYRQPVSLILIDIDRFKEINDTFGHRTGDGVLCNLIAVIAGSIRSMDALFRWGGEEFLVMMPSTSHRAAAALAERIRKEVEQYQFAEVGRVTISLGVAEHMLPEPTDSWFNRVDTALYRAKKGGRNRVSVDPQGSSDLWAAEGGGSAIRLVWHEAYECGEPTIDRQHQELFDLSNIVLDAAFKLDMTPSALGAAMEDLHEHIQRHFEDEEELLKRHPYGELVRHQRSHRRLLRRAKELKAAVEGGTSSMGGLVDFLVNAVVAQHIFKMDRNYYPLFRK